MGSIDKKALEALAREAAKSIKTEFDLDYFRKMLTKVTVEVALNTKFNEHLGYLKPVPISVMAIWVSQLSLIIEKPISTSLSTKFTLSSISIVSWLRCIKTSKSSTKRFILHCASILKVIKTCLECGSLKRKVPSFGLTR